MPEVFFKIVHSTLEETSEIPAYRDQTVEVALGPKGFVEGNSVTLTRRITPSHVVNAVPPAWGKPRQPKKPTTPRIIELLHAAIRWKALLESGEVLEQNEIARSEGLTKARVSQIMSLLRLDPKIQQHILSMPDMVGMPAVTERSLRPIAGIEDPRQQVEKFEELASK